MSDRPDKDYRQYQKAAWNTLASDYGETDPLSAVISRGGGVSNYYFDKATKTILAHTTEPQAEWSVADIGCGIGRLSEWLAPQVKSVVGIDLSDEMVKIARKRAETFGLRNLTFMVSDGVTVPIEDQSVDLLVCSSVLKYVMDDGDLERLVARICEIAKPGGHIAVIEEVDNGGPIELGDADIAGAAVLRSAERYVVAFENKATLLHH